jgi:putative aldouronate transport system permease protein
VSRPQTGIVIIRRSLWNRITYHRTAYLMALPALLYFLFIRYLPMYGLVMAFQDYKPWKGTAGSAWVGLKYFRDVLSSASFWAALRNTLILNGLKFAFIIPLTLLFALLLNELRLMWFKRGVQTVMLLPYFLSWAIIAVFVYNLFSYEYGLINRLLVALGRERFDWYNTDTIWRGLLTGMYLWKNLGWGCIFYLAAISAINPELYESAWMDGAGRLRQALHITIPSIMPMFVVILIINVSFLLAGDFEQIYAVIGERYQLYPKTDILPTFIYRAGLGQSQFSFSTAVGLFNSVFSTLLIVLANQLAKLVRREQAFSLF